MDGNATFFRFWVDGIYNGIASQYQELKDYSGSSTSPMGYGLEAGYLDVAGGSRLEALFKSVCHSLLFNFYNMHIPILGLHTKVENSSFEIVFYVEWMILMTH